MGSKNHELVPATLVAIIAKQRPGGVSKILRELARLKLVAAEANARYDGVRLCYGGYDFLALRKFAACGSLTAVGNQIGVGKESDVLVGYNEAGEALVLKMHRLGRVSFRTVKNNRDYLQHRRSASWLYLSRLSAAREYAFMCCLHANGFPVPRPVDHNRHCIVMEFLSDAIPLYQISATDFMGDEGEAVVASLYAELMALIVRLARHGLIHGDFNEFNLMVREKTRQVVLIDFPQMLSTQHQNAEEYFNRDVECIRVFFRKKFGYDSAVYPVFRSDALSDGAFRLDVLVEASGYKGKEGRSKARSRHLAAEDSQSESCSDEDSHSYSNNEDEDSQSGSDIEDKDSHSGSDNGDEDSQSDSDNELKDLQSDSCNEEDFQSNSCSGKETLCNEARNGPETEKDLCSGTCKSAPDNDENSCLNCRSNSELCKSYPSQRSQISGSSERSFDEKFVAQDGASKELSKVFDLNLNILS